MNENFILNYTVFNENDDPSFSSKMVQIPVRMLYKDTVFADTLKYGIQWYKIQSNNEPHKNSSHFWHQM